VALGWLEPVPGDHSRGLFHSWDDHVVELILRLFRMIRLDAHADEDGVHVSPSRDDMDRGRSWRVKDATRVLEMAPAGGRPSEGPGSPMPGFRAFRPAEMGQTCVVGPPP